MTTKKYSPWIKWHGGERPVPPDTKVEVRYRCGALDTGHSADQYTWRHGIGDYDIVEYCTVTEQPDLEAAEQLLRDNGYKIIPPTRSRTFEAVVPMTEAPKAGTKYWVVHAFISKGVAKATWYAGDMDKAALRHRMAYLEKEHALIAAQHIFGLKGGEL